MIGCVPCKGVFGDKAATQANSEQMYGISLVVADCLKKKLKTIFCATTSECMKLYFGFAVFLNPFIASLRSISIHFRNMEEINVSSLRVSILFGAVVHFEVNLSIISSYWELFQFTELWCAWSSFSKKLLKLQTLFQVGTRCVPVFHCNLRVWLFFWTILLHLHSVLYQETRLNVSEEKALSYK